MATKMSSFVKLMAGLGLCLAMAGGLLAQPTMTVSLAGTLGPYITGAGRLTGGTYISGVTATGTTGQTCLLTFATPPTGTAATGILTFSGTTLGTVIEFATADGGNGGDGYSFSSPPTQATASVGGPKPATSCSGTATVTTLVDDPLKLNGTSFTGTITANPVGVTYSAGSVSYPVSVTLAAGGFTLPCTGTSTVTVNNASDGGNDTLSLSGCSFLGGSISFTTTIAVPSGTFPSPIPLAFGTANLVTSPDTASSGTYAGGGDSTTLGIKGTISAACSNCPAMSLTGLTGGGLTFSAQQGGAAPASQSIGVSNSPAENEAFAVFTSTTSGGNWLSATAGGQIPGTISVSVNPNGLTANTYKGTVTVYSAASNSPVSATITFTVSPPSFTLNQPSALTFTSVNSSAPAAQPVTVATTPSESVSFTAAPTSTGNWLGVTPTSGTTGSSISVTANPSDTAGPGPYTGQIALNATGASNNPVNVAVTFNVTTVTTSPAPTPGMSFSGTAGGANPPTQTLSVTSTSTTPNLPYTASASSTGNWLGISSTSGTTNGSPITVSITTTGLAAKTYTGTINITPTGYAAIPVTVTLTLTSLPLLVSTPGSLTFSYSPTSSPNAQTLNITSSPSTATLNYTVSASSTGNWLQATASGGTTPGSSSVSINTAAAATLATGTYTGAVLITCTPSTSCGNTNGGTAGQLSVPVTLTVTAVLSPNPTSLTYNYTINGAAPGSQTIGVTSTGGAITYTPSVAPGAAWLSVSPASPTSVTTPDTLTVSVSTTGLAANTYHGSIVLTPTFSGNSPISIPVTFNVSAEPALSVTGGPLTFNMYDLGSLPGGQSLSVSASGGANVPFTATVTQGNAWLSAASSGGTTPGSVSVSILANSLAPGQYTGNVQVNSTQASGGPINVTVTLNVATPPNLVASPSPMAFAFQTGGANPANQQLMITSNTSGAQLSFTAVASTNTGGAWLAVTAPNGATPQTLTVSIVPSVLSTLTPNNYTGQITLTSAQAGDSPLTVPVTLTVSALPSLTTAPSSLSANYTIGGSVPTFPQVSVGTTGSSPLTGVSASTTTPWLSVTQSSTTTPVTLTVSLVSAALSSLPTGPNVGSIMIAASGAQNSPLTYTVTLNVAAQPTLSASPNSLSFSGTAGSPTQPPSQNITVSAANGTIGFTAVASPSGTWLSVAPTSGSTSSSTTLQVSVNTNGLAANTYNGSITVTSTTSGTTGGPFVIPVTLVVSSNSLTASPASFSFTYTLGGSAPATQTVNIGSTIAGLSFTAVPGASWLGVAPGSGTTPQTLTLSIVTTGLTAQTYNTNLTITSAGAGNSPLTVPVKLTVSAEPTLTALPNSLSYSYTSGAAAPAGQSVAVSTSNGAAAVFSVSATTNGGGNWLQVPANLGAAAISASFVANIVPANLTATSGTFTGTITVSAPGFTSATVAVTLVVSQPKAVIQVTGNTSFTLANTSAPAGSTLAVSASDGSSQPFTIAVVSGQNNWLTVSPGSGTAPANITLTANPAGLAPGVYLASIVVTMPALPVSTKTIQAQLTITGSNLAASPSMLSFNYQPGGQFPASQSIALTTASGTGTVALSSVTTSAGWLSVTPASSAPATLKVSINPGLLSPGNYFGAVIVTGLGSPTASLEIPVTLVVNTVPVLTVSPSALTFSYQAGGAVPAAQSFSVASGNVPVNFAVTSPGNWLTLSPATGTTPGSVLVTVNPTGLAAGTYGGTITVSGFGTNSATVAVTLSVTGAPQLTVAPSQLSFASPVNGPAPAPQTLTVTSGSGALSFTAAAGSTWLSVTPTSGTTPATLAVSVNPAGLAQGTYNGSIDITQSGSANPIIVIVTLQVGAVTTPTISGVINAASGVAGTVAPGMAISIFGTGLGPQTSASFALPPQGGTVATTLAGTQVLFDGTAAPVLYTSSTQVNALVPYELASKASTVMTVMFDNTTSAGDTLPVVAAEPGIFTANGSGKGQGSILNQDYSINSSTNPAAAGSVIQIFGTGGGVTDPASIDGALNPIPPPLGSLVLTTTATVNGQTATVDYAGPAPGLVSGIIQINVTIPDGTPSGNIPVIVTIACPVAPLAVPAACGNSPSGYSFSSQTTVTVAVQ